MIFETLGWAGTGLEILDQRLLPLEEHRILLDTVDGVCDAIRTLAVRGAPAIGVAAAYGVVVAALERTDEEYVRAAIGLLGATRPTAVNLFTALDFMSATVGEAFSSGSPVERLLAAAREFHDNDLMICKKLSENGAELLGDGDSVLTHCNAGALATSGWGTALGVIYAAVEQGKKIRVFADETRPLLQGARLTAWELHKSGVPVTLICDNMAADVMRRGLVDHVIVGADRIAANGDTANKIGTYGVSVLARGHGIPFYVAAPVTSFDFSISSGADIPIEERTSSEVHTIAGNRIAPDGISFFNPAFDVTPSENISAVITELGVAVPPYGPVLAEWARGGRVARKY